MSKCAGCKVEFGAFSGKLCQSLQYMELNSASVSASNDGVFQETCGGASGDGKEGHWKEFRWKQGENNAKLSRPGAHRRKNVSRERLMSLDGHCVMG